MSSDRQLVDAEAAPIHSRPTAPIAMPFRSEGPMTSLQVLRFPRTFARKLLVAVVALLATVAAAAAAAPSGRAVMAFHVTISPSWFDPSAAPPQITPFGVLYAIHDALVRPYPGHKMGPSLA